MCGLADEFSEEGVGPGEPRSRELGGVVFVVGLVDESGTGRGCFQHLDCVGNFSVGTARERVDSLGHGPDHVAADMGSANALTRGPAEEPWIAFAPDEVSRSGVNGCIG